MESLKLWVSTCSIVSLYPFNVILNRSPVKWKGLEWLPVVGLVFFMVGYSVGFATVPFVLLGELLPTKFRSTLGSVATAWNLTNTFLVIKGSVPL